MQTAANISLVLTDFSSLKRFADSQNEISYGGFYQRLASELVKRVHSKHAFRAVGERLVVLAEHAHAFRQMGALDQVSQVLMNSVPRQFEVAGQYYQALCIQRFGRGNLEQAARMIERVAEYAAPRYRVRALISLGANSFHKGDSQSALSLYCEAGRLASLDGMDDPYATIHIQKMVAFIDSLEGNHRDALALLENLFPLARAVRSSQPHVYYDYMNSLAVELCEVGRLEEAKNASQIALASPFAPAYPEWRETREEIELRGCRASRATVAFSRRTPEVENLVCLPVPERQGSASRQEHIPGHTKQRARVLDLLEWKKKMGKEPNDTPRDKKSYKEMDGRQMLLKIMELTGSKDRTDDELQRILEAIDRVLSEPKDKGKH